MSPLKSAFAILFGLLFVTISSKAISPNMPTVLKIKEQDLVLNGSGVRTKYCINLFRGGLYLKTKSQDATQIVNANELMAIKIEVTSDVITSSRLEKNMRSEFVRVSNGKMNLYQSRVDELVKALCENVKTGDVYDLIYIPEKGLFIYKNKQVKSTIKGLDFKQMLFSIWLGEDPADHNLKNGMLGHCPS